MHLHDFTCGAPSGTRTRDLCRDRATSTPTGPPGHRVVRLVGLGIEWVSVVGHRAGGRHRTRDILVTNQALCRTELHRRVECRLPAERRVGSGPRFDLVYTGETLNTRQNRRESRRKTTWRPALPSRWSLLLRSVSLAKILGRASQRHDSHVVVALEATVNFFLSGSEVGYRTRSFAFKARSPDLRPPEWMGWRGSNTRHAASETAALPTELHPKTHLSRPREGCAFLLRLDLLSLAVSVHLRHGITSLAWRVRVELTIFGFGRRCLVHLVTPTGVRQAGLEPATPRLGNEYSVRLSYWRGTDHRPGLRRRVGEAGVEPAKSPEFETGAFTKI